MKNRILALHLLALTVSNSLVADDWPQFLGPNRDGVSVETGLISEFPESGPEVVWRVPLGVGMSGIAIADGKAFTTFQDNQSQYTVALDAATGEKLWQVKLASVYENSMGNGPRATPTVDDGTVYVFTGEGVLTALNATDGRSLWSADTVKLIGGKPADYGMSSSPLVTKTGVVVHVGSPNGCVACFDCKTGKSVWAAGNEFAGYSSPVLVTLAGKQQIVSLVGAEVLGLNPADGNKLWTYRFETEYSCNTANPVVIGDSKLLISAGENHGSVILQLSVTDNQWKIAEAWTSFGKDSALRAEWQTPVFGDGGIIYGLDNIGSAGPITNLVAVKADDGSQLWMEKRFGKSNFVAADGKLFMTTMRGEIVIGTADATGYTETARATVMGMTRQAPAIANGKLFLRDDKEIVCINVKSK